MRRFRDLVDDIVGDLGGRGGLSTGQLQLPAVARGSAPNVK
jgi:hypothetical protein